MRFPARACTTLLTSLLFLDGCTDGTGPEDEACVDVPRVTSVPVPLSLWSQVTTSGTSPAGRWRHAVAYDNATDRLIVVGGLTASGAVSDIWVLSNATGIGGAATWTQQSPSGAFSARSEHVVGYSAATNQLVSYGGVNASNQIVNDSWRLNNANGASGTSSWTPLTPIGAPAELRTGQASGYDGANNRLTLTGGVRCLNGTCTNYSDTWVISNATGVGGNPQYVQLAVGATSPPGRYYATGAYDPTANRLFMFGGFASDGSKLSDAWRLSGANGLSSASWTSATSATTPVARNSHTTVFDAPRARFVIFGGTGSDNIVRSDVWMFSSDAGVWTQYAPASSPRPQSRTAAGAAVSTTHNRMIVFGGNVGNSILVNDVWTLNLVQPAATSVEIVSGATRVCETMELEFVAIVRAGTEVIDQVVDWFADDDSIEPATDNPNVGELLPGDEGTVVVHACLRSNPTVCSANITITRFAAPAGTPSSSFDGNYTATVTTTTPAGNTTGNSTFAVTNGSVSDPGGTFTGTVNQTTGAFTGSSIVCQGCSPLAITGTFHRTNEFTLSGSSGSVSQTIRARKIS